MRSEYSVYKRLIHKKFLFDMPITLLGCIILPKVSMISNDNFKKLHTVHLNLVFHIFSRSDDIREKPGKWPVEIDVPLCIGGYAPGSVGFCDICLFREPCTTDTERKL